MFKEPRSCISAVSPNPRDMRGNDELRELFRLGVTLWGEFRGESMPDIPEMSRSRRVLSCPISLMSGGTNDSDTQVIRDTASVPKVVGNSSLTGFL